jgi:hypothetical protein
MESVVDEGDAAGVVGGRDAVLRHDDRHTGSDGRGVPDGDAERVGSVLPAHLGQLVARARCDRAVRTDPPAGVGLDAEPVVVTADPQVAVFPRLGVVGPGCLGSRHRLERLRRHGPAHRGDALLVQYVPAGVVGSVQPPSRMNQAGCVM